MHRPDRGIDPRPLARDEAAALALRAAAGDRGAEAELCRRTLALALKVAARHRGRMELDDAFGAASVALVEAARRFDPARGCRWTTYAAAAMRNAVAAAESAHADAIPVPVAAARMRRAAAAGRRAGRTESEQRRAAAAATIRVVRLDADDGNGGTAAAELPDRGARGGPDPGALARVDAATAALGPAGRVLIRGRLGLDGPASTRAEAAAALGISAAAAREAERWAVARLRAILAPPAR